MFTEAELLAAVGEEFEETGRGLVVWPDPHAGRSPREEEYSRVADPGKWRILGARADAWLRALAGAGLAAVERDAAVHWRPVPGTVVSRADRAVPLAAGGLPLVIARSRIDEVDDAGVTLGVADPAVCISWIPSCGCDACDWGAQGELDQLDDAILAVVRGTFRRLSSGDRQVIVLGDGTWNATNVTSDDVPALLAAPGAGWAEVSGRPWLS